MARVGAIFCVNHMLHAEFEQALFRRAEMVNLRVRRCEPLMQMKFLKYCIIRCDDSMCVTSVFLLLHSLKSIFIMGYLWGRENVNFYSCWLSSRRDVLFSINGLLIFKPDSTPSIGVEF